MTYLGLQQIALSNGETPLVVVGTRSALGQL